jgi:preprotein translocase subunit SecF
MPVWGWILLIAGLVGLILLLGFIWGRKTSGGAQMDRQALSEAREKAFQRQIEAEQAAKEKAQEAAKELAEDQKKIAAWFEKEKSKISEEAKNEFEKLVSDPAALDRKLNNLLSFTAVGEPPSSPED